MKRGMRSVWLGGVAAGLFGITGALGQALPAPVEQTTLARDAFSTGTLSRGEGALPADLWRSADVGRLAWLMNRVPARYPGPAVGDALRRVLLSPGDAPAGATPALGGRKLVLLAEAGFTEEARTIASLSSATPSEPTVAEALATADLLDGARDAACRRGAGLTSGREEAFWVKLRVLCYAVSGERDAADLTLNLLRERGAMDGDESDLLTALSNGVAPKTPVAPQTALQYAAIVQLDLPLAPALLDGASAGVLKAIARNGDMDSATRVAAANRAAAMGVVAPGDLAAFYESFEVDVADLGRAGDIARSRPGDPMADVIVFQSIRQMTAPEFLRDKAARIAEALAAADSFSRSYALSLLYADDIEALEGALLTPREAGRFAAARMTIGDSDGAARWLFAMIGSGGLSSLDEVDAMEMIELANLLAVLDPISARAVGEAAGIAISAPTLSVAGGGAGGDMAVVARIVESAFDAAVADIPGQAALAAVALSSIAAPGDRVSAVVIDQSLRAAGLNDLRRRIEFESAWRARFAGAGGNPQPARPSPAPAGGNGGDKAGGDGDGAPAPRLKPPVGE